MGDEDDIGGGGAVEQRPDAAEARRQQVAQALGPCRQPRVAFGMRPIARARRSGVNLVPSG